MVTIAPGMAKDSKTGADSTTMMISLPLETAAPAEVELVATEMESARRLPTTLEMLGRTNAGGTQTTQTTVVSMMMLISLPPICAALVEVDLLHHLWILFHHQSGVS